MYASTHLQAQTLDTTAYYDSGAVLVSPELPQVDAIQKFDSVTTADARKVQTRTVNRNTLKKLREEDDFWYYNTAPPAKKIVQTKKKQPVIPAPWLSYFLWTIVISAFVAFIIWFLVNSNVQIFKKSSKRISGTANEQETEDIFEMNYDAKINAAIAVHNYRLAIRYMYLRLLTQLSQKGLINYGQQKTNIEYVSQLYGTPYYSFFFRITRHFEYTWYGVFALSHAEFSSMKEEFDHLKKLLQV